MKIKITTKSGAIYILDSDAMTWERHSSVPIYGLSVEQNRGTLADWPAIITGRQLLLDDLDIGQIISTTVMATEVIRK